MISARTPVTDVRKALKAALQGAGVGVVITYDYLAAADAGNAILIDQLAINYEYDLDMGSYRSLTAGLNLFAKTQEDLDQLVDAIDGLNDTSRDILRDIMIEKVTFNEDDADLKTAKIDINARIDEPE